MRKTPEGTRDMAQVVETIALRAIARLNAKDSEIINHLDSPATEGLILGVINDIVKKEGAVVIDENLAPAFINAVKERVKKTLDEAHLREAAHLSETETRQVSRDIQRMRLEEELEESSDPDKLN